MDKTQRNHSVILLRLVAAFLVLSGHMSYICGGQPAVLWGEPVQGMGVKIFFLLGGVLITRSWQSDPHPLRYAIKRFFRIWPPLAAYVLAAALVIGPVFSSLPVGEYFSSPLLVGYLNNLRLYIVYALPGLFESNPYPNAVNGSLWTLPVEVAMYLLVPLLCTLLALIKNRRARTAAAWCIAAAACAARLVLNTIPGASCIVYATNWVSAMDIIPYYLIGMAYACSDFQKYLNVPAALGLMMVYTALGLEGPLRQLLFFPLFSYLLLSLAFGVTITAQRIPFQKLEISYGVYLWGFFVQQLFAQMLVRHGWTLPFTAQLFICTAISAALGWLSDRAVETPAQEARRRLLAHLPAPKATPHITRL